MISQVALLTVATLIGVAATWALSGSSSSGGGGVFENFSALLTWNHIFDHPAAAAAAATTTTTMSSSSLPSSLVAGVLAAIPMIAFADYTERSSSDRQIHRIDFDTMHFVMTLFGRRRRRKFQQQQQQQDDDVLPPMMTETTSTNGNNGDEMRAIPTTTTTTTTTGQVLAHTFGLALVTSVSEEVVFRGYLPSLIILAATTVVAVPAGPLPAIVVVGTALVGQALAFGLAHYHQETPPPTKQKKKKNNRGGAGNTVLGGGGLAAAAQNNDHDHHQLLMVELQAMNGLWYGLVYLTTGGNLLPCIVAVRTSGVLLAVEVSLLFQKRKISTSFLTVLLHLSIFYPPLL